ncbi:cupin domain-containing protein [Botrimarina sp.]|uniref:cupin domain-containing protein n=1 Tax=Botrimarina sp. TaxID=2795802 RepID=UPI0032EAA0C6
MPSIVDRVEFVTRVGGSDGEPLARGVALTVLASGDRGARGLTTALAAFSPNTELPTHVHACGEAMVIVEGAVVVQVENRRYRLTRLDSLFVPAGVPHSVGNASSAEDAVVHVSFPSDAPDRQLVEPPTDKPEDRSAPPAGGPESIRRFADVERYELATDAEFTDLFASRFGSSGVCGGYGRFQPGSSLPCHTHHYDESISIIEGAAVCQVAGREHELSGCDTACVPEGAPHRFINRSDAPMAMIWVYAGDEPDREIVENALCAAPR